MNQSIFVQMASYRDPECQKTVQNLFDMATHPERVFIGICWQYDKVADKDCFQIPSPRPEQTRASYFRFEESRGVCWARHEAQKLYRGEDYVLMIDSHMRFVAGWDELLIAEMALCDSAKPVLSCYPPAYDLPDNLAENPQLTILRAQEFDERGDIRFRGECLASTPPGPLNGAFIAAGFLFASGALMREVPYDPYLYFDQEEITFCVRMYTHGWDVFSPSKIICYHLYNIEQQGKPRHWNDHKDWPSLQLKGRARSHYLLGMKNNNVSKDDLVEIEKYCLGRARTLRQFELYSGLDFTTPNASERALKALFIKDLNLYR